MPKISVVVPCYNVEEYLKECLDKIIEQTLEDIEIICVDDGSDDSTFSILKDYEQNDSRIKVFHQENKGVASARNLALKEATGEFIAFMDPDDYYPDENTLKKLYETAIKNDVKICGGSLIKLENNNYITTFPKNEKEFRFEEDKLWDYKDYQFDYGYWRFIYNRQFLEENNIIFPDYLRQQDPPFFIKAMLKAQKFYAIKEPTYVYRVSHKTIKWSERKVRDMFFGIYDCLKLSKEEGLYELFNKISLRMNSWTFRTAVCATFQYEGTKEAALRVLGLLDMEKLKQQGFELDIVYKIFLNTLDDKPLLSVIVPVYNTGKYLKECLYSIVNQTLGLIEIICVYKESNDNSLEILKEFAKNDSRIKIISQEQPYLSGARNAGLKIAKGQYIGFVDSDDWIDLEYFEKLCQKALLKEADIARSTYKYSFSDFEEDSEINGFIKKAVNQNRDLNPNEHSVVVWNAIYKRDFLIENDILYFDNFYCTEDITYTQRATFLSKRTSPVDEVYYHYRKEVEGALSAAKDPLVVLRATSTACEFLNSGNFKKEDYIEAYQRHVRRLDISYRETCKTKNYNQKEFLEGFCSIIKNYKYKKEYLALYEKAPAVRFLKKNKIKKYKEFCLQNIIASLTSYPKRIDSVHITIKSILEQSLKPDKVVLWLSEKEFPNKFDSLPKELTELLDKGLEIGWCDREVNTKSYKKIIPALKKYPDSIIITFDDDIIYPKNCIESLYGTYLRNPDCVIANRAHYVTFNKEKINPYNDWIMCSNFNKPSFNLLQTGVGAVLYPKNCFYKDILKEYLFLKLAKNTDDLWLWAMLVLNNRKVKTTGCFDCLKFIDGTQECGLWQTLNQNGGNDKNLKLLFKHYPKILRKLEKSNGFYKTKLEWLFSIKNDSRKTHKIVSLFGMKLLKYKSQKLITRKQIEELEGKITYLSNERKRLHNKTNWMDGRLREAEKQVCKLNKELSESAKKHKTEIQKSSDKTLELEKKLDNIQQPKGIEKITPRPYLTNFVVDIASHCNLNCKGCDHFSPLAQEGYYDLGQFKSDIERLAYLTGGQVDKIGIMGGEPLLNKDVLEYLKIAKENFSNTKIRLVTNGILLSQQSEEFYQTLQKLNVFIEYTKYDINLNHEKIDEMISKYNLNLDVFGYNKDIVKTSYKIPIDVNGNQDILSNFINCFHANNCIMLKNGRLYTCTVAPSIEHFNKYFNKNIPLTQLDGIDIHKANNIKEVLDSLARPMPFCKYCNVKGRKFNLKWDISKKDIEEWT